MEPDLKLIIDAGSEVSPIEIRVYSQVMSNASPYFHKLLHPTQFAEGNTLRSTGSLDLRLPDTNAEAMQILCDIFHLRNDEVPRSNITSAQLFHLAVLVDKFSCERPVHIWTGLWLAQTHIQDEIRDLVEARDTPSVQALCKWICISHNLRFDTYNKKLISLLLRHHTAHDLVSEEDEKAEVDFVSQSLIFEIDQKRACLTGAFRAIMIEFESLFAKGNTCQRLARETPVGFEVHNSEVETDDDFNCCSIALGNFVLAAQREFGSDWHEPTAWVGSIDSTYHHMQEVARKLNGTSQIAVGGLRTRKALHSSHEMCSLSGRFMTRIDQAMKDMGL